MSDSDKHVTDWLRDAHAMEQQAETMLKGEISRIEHYPELRHRLEEELEKNRLQQEQLKQCLSRLGEKHSTLKDTGAKVMAFAQSLSGVVVSDEVVKGAMALYVFTQMEICSYKILAEAAAVRIDEQTRQTCEGLMKTEEEFAAWLMDYMPKLTREFLRRSDGDNKHAKR